MSVPARAGRWGLAFAPVAGLLVMGTLQRWIGDDGLINVRVASQLLQGNGFVFNAGERVEAVTSPLWLALLTAAGALGCPLAQAAVWLGLVGSVGGALCATLAAGNLIEEEPRRGVWLPLGSLVYASIPAAWDYATSGLENGLGLGWIGLTFLTLSRALGRRGSHAGLGAAIVAGLGPLIRPDFALFTAGFGALALFTASFDGRRFRAIAKVAMALALPAVTYQVFRMGYFASLVPNTALAKEAFEARWDQGLRYLQNTTTTYALGVPLVCALGSMATVIRGQVRDRKIERAALLFVTALCGVAHLLYVVRLGGDFMHARMLLPGLFATLAPVAAVHFGVGPWRAWRGRWLLLPWLVIACWSAYCAGTLRVARANQHGVGDERGWYTRKARVDNPMSTADYRHFDFYLRNQRVRRQIARSCPRGEGALVDTATDRCRGMVLTTKEDGRLSDHKTVLELDPSAVGSHVVAVLASRPLGIPSNVVGLRVHVVDYFGLADPVASRLRLPRGPRGRPGHEKRFGTAWLAARFALPFATTDPQVAAGKRALHCGLLAELVRAVREPMDASRFARNLALAWSLHRMRVPEDPRQAEALFCGTTKL